MSDVTSVNALHDSVPSDRASAATQSGATICSTSECTVREPARNPRPADELSQPQRSAIELLLQGLSDTAVARELGVDRTTVFRWRKKQAFRKDLERERRLMWRQSVKRIQSLVTPALD